MLSLWQILYRKSVRSSFYEILNIFCRYIDPFIDLEVRVFKNKTDHWYITQWVNLNAQLTSINNTGHMV